MNVNSSPELTSVHASKADNVNFMRRTWLDHSALLGGRSACFHVHECGCANCQNEWFLDDNRAEVAAEDEAAEQTRRWLALTSLYTPKPNEMPLPVVEDRVSSRKTHWPRESDAEKLIRFEEERQLHTGELPSALAEDVVAQLPATEADKQPPAEDAGAPLPSAPTRWWYYLTAEEEEEGPFESATMMEWVLAGQLPPYLLLRAADDRGRAYTPIGTLVAPGGELEAALAEAAEAAEAAETAAVEAARSAVEVAAAEEAALAQVEAAERARIDLVVREREALAEAVKEAERDARRTEELDVIEQLRRVGTSPEAVESYMRHLPSDVAIRLAEDAAALELAAKAAADEAAEAAEKAAAAAAIALSVSGTSAKGGVATASSSSQMMVEAEARTKADAKALLVARAAREDEAKNREKAGIEIVGSALREAVKTDRLDLDVELLQVRIAAARALKMAPALIDAAKAAGVVAERAQREASGRLRRGPEWTV